MPQANNSGVESLSSLTPIQILEGVGPSPVGFSVYAFSSLPSFTNSPYPPQILRLVGISPPLVLVLGTQDCLSLPVSMTLHIGVPSSLLFQFFSILAHFRYGLLVRSLEPNTSRPASPPSHSLIPGLALFYFPLPALCASESTSRRTLQKARLVPPLNRLSFARCHR